MPLQGEFIGE